ncbi:MAG: hypothetical protein FK734_05730 [Asgard group archaeon]|nr:hypothetical protein [Asgard group archaeon]
MTTSSKQSSSFDYVFTKWYQDVVNYYKEYFEDFQEILKINKTDILPIIIELQKSLGKEKDINIIEQKEILKKQLEKMDFKLIEFREFIKGMIFHISRIDDYEIKLSAKQILLNLLNHYSDIFHSLEIAYKNIIKSANIIFIRKKKPDKKSEDNFTSFYKEYNQLQRMLNRDYELVFTNSQNALNTLKDEVERAKLELIKRSLEATQIK